MEIKILDFIQSLRNPLLDEFFRFFTTIGNRAELWLVIIAILLCTKKYRKVAFYAILAIALEVLIVEGIVKNLVQRPRPFYAVQDIVLLIKEPSGFSFPSGHAASSFAVATLLYLNDVKFKKIIMTLASIMALSRLYVYVHYPTDVLVGVCLGIGIGYLMNYLMKNQDIVLRRK